MVKINNYALYRAVKYVIFPLKIIFCIAMLIL